LRAGSAPRSVPDSMPDRRIHERSPGAYPPRHHAADNDRPTPEVTLRFETLAVHAAAAPDPVTGAVMPAIHLSTTFLRSPDGSFPSGYAYIRDANPNRAALESAMTSLEGGAAAVAFASGMAAT